MRLNDEVRRGVGRKILHVIIGITGLLLIIYGLATPMVIFFVLIVGILLSLLSLRFKIPVLSYFLDTFEKAEDKNFLPGRGIIFAVAGALLALKLYPPDIAYASIIILIFADPISYLVGKYMGRTRSILDKRKYIEGNIAGFIISSGFAMFFVHPALAIAGSLIAMVFETMIIEVQKIQVDDNLIIPLSAGTTMLLIQIFFG